MNIAVRIIVALGIVGLALVGEWVIAGCCAFLYGCVIAYFLVAPIMAQQRYVRTIGNIHTLERSLGYTPTTPASFAMSITEVPITTPRARYQVIIGTKGVVSSTHIGLISGPIVIPPPVPKEEEV